MKTTYSPAKTASLVALLVGLSPALVAESSSSKQKSSDKSSQHSSQMQNSQKSSGSGSGSQSSQMQLRQAPADPRGRSAGELLGMDVYGSGGEQLGNVHDFIVDGQSGKIAHVVVASGGTLGVGADLRPVPIQACNLQNDRLTVDVNQQKWTQAPVFTEAQFASLSQDKRAKEVYQFFGQKQPNEQKNPQFVMVSDIRGREVFSSGQQVGEIDEVIIQPKSKTAAALLDPNDDFAGTDQNYIVPLNKLQNIQDDSTPLRTSLTRQDFSRAGQTSDDSWATPDGYLSAVYVWPVYTVDGTGSGSASQTSMSRNQQSGSQSRSQSQAAGSQGQPPLDAVRQAVRAEAPNAQQDIRITREQDKLVIRGTVPSEDLKNRIEQRAEDAAQGWDIENQLRVASNR